MEVKKLLLVGAILALVVLADYANSANILVITFFSSKSHKITYMPLIEELAKKGHQFTVVSPLKPFKEIPNVKEIFTLDLEKIFEDNNFNAFESKEKEEQMDPSRMVHMTLEACNRSYDLPQVKALLNEKFDLVFYQPVFNDCILGLIYRLQAPFVWFTPTGAPSFIVDKAGGNLPPSFHPNFMLGYDPEMNFYQRFMNFGMEHLSKLYMAYSYEPAMEKIYREKLGQDIPSIKEIANNVSLILSNTHFSLTGPKPYLPDVVDVGGIHSHPAKPVPKDIEDFIQKGKDGFILFSMGSAIKGDMMPEYKRKMILNVFSKLKQQVLWKWESETMPDLPKNVKLSKWLPQQDLLGHKDIKMFITHCGGGSTEESIYHGVPILGLPMLGDQPINANFAEKHGFIVKLEWNKLEENELHLAIQEVLTNPKYRENVKKLSTLFKDRPMDPLKQGVYWVEYVLRHGGAPHLRSAGRKLNYFQYHSYDVIAAYLLTICTIGYVAFAILRFTFKKICCRSKKSTRMTNGKKMN